MTQSQDKVLMLAIKAGEILIRSGAEIYRVDDAIKRICHTCGITYIETFSTPTGIILSLGHGFSTDEEEVEHRLGTIVKRVSGISTDLEKVSRVTHFVDQFSKGETSVDAGLQILAEIDAIKGFSLPIKIIGVALTALFFSFMNGNDILGAFCALVVGTVSYIISIFIDGLKINRFITIFVSCFIAAGLSLLCINLGLGNSLSATIIGALIIFLPGVAITNAARDLLAGDMLSGVARVTEALLVAIALAGGVGIMLQIAPTPQVIDAPASFHIAVQFLFAFLGTLGLSIMVNIPKRYLLLVSLVAACGWLVYSFIIDNATLEAAGSMKPIACFAGACTVALLAEVFTRITRDAATVFIIPAIFPFVPGIGMYNTLSFVLNNDITSAVHVGMETIFMAGSIAFALLVVISLTRTAKMALTWARGMRDKG